MTDDSKQIQKKLDIIIAKLDGIEKAAAAKQEPEISKDLREEFKAYMLSNFNISWIDDKVEADIYDSLFDFIEKFV